MAPSNECLTEEICELNEGTAKSLHMVQLHYLGRGHLVVAVAISISQCRDRDFWYDYPEVWGMDSKRPR